MKGDLYGVMSALQAGESADGVDEDGWTVRRPTRRLRTCSPPALQEECRSIEQASACRSERCCHISFTTALRARVLRPSDAAGASLRCIARRGRHRQGSPRARRRPVRPLLSATVLRENGGTAWRLEHKRQHSLLGLLTWDASAPRSDTLDTGGLTPLQIALSSGKAEVAKLLKRWAAIKVRPRTNLRKQPQSRLAWPLPRCAAELRAGTDTRALPRCLP